MFSVGTDFSLPVGKYTKSQERVAIVTRLSLPLIYFPAMSRKRASASNPPMTAERAFGLVLRQLRTEAGYTQADLESDTRIDRSYISQLENGHRQACLKTIIQLAFKLNMHPGELVDAVVERMDAAELDKLR